MKIMPKQSQSNNKPSRKQSFPVPNHVWMFWYRGASGPEPGKGKAEAMRTYLAAYGNEHEYEFHLSIFLPFRRQNPRGRRKGRERERRHSLLIRHMKTMGNTEKTLATSKCITTFHVRYLDVIYITPKLSFVSPQKNPTIQCSFACSCINVLYAFPQIAYSEATHVPVDKIFAALFA